MLIDLDDTMDELCRAANRGEGNHIWVPFQAYSPSLVNLKIIEAIFWSKKREFFGSRAKEKHSHLVWFPVSKTSKAYAPL